MLRAAKNYFLKRYSTGAGQNGRKKISCAYEIFCGSVLEVGPMAAIWNRRINVLIILRYWQFQNEK